MVFALDFFLFGINSPSNTWWPLTPVFPTSWSITWSTFDLGRFFWASQTSSWWSNARFGPSLGSRATARYRASLTRLEIVTSLFYCHQVNNTYTPLSPVFPACRCITGFSLFNFWLLRASLATFCRFLAGLGTCLCSSSSAVMEKGQSLSANKSVVS